MTVMCSPSKVTFGGSKQVPYTCGLKPKLH